MKQFGKLLVKIFVIVALLGILFAIPFMSGHLQPPQNPLSHKEANEPDDLLPEDFTLTKTVTLPDFDISSIIPQYVQTPEGGISWDVLAETKAHEYNYMDEDDFEWTGFRPEFSENLKKLDGETILIQGYMFPLSQDEKQAVFLLGPFPVSCPYHYHIPPRLIIEVTAKDPVGFSYDAVNIKGVLELVPKDDEYNVFYRLKDAEALK